MSSFNAMDDFLDGVNTPEEAANLFRVKLPQFLSYLERIESLPEQKRTQKEKELIAKFGNKK